MSANEKVGSVSDFVHKSFILSAVTMRRKEDKYEFMGRNNSVCFGE